jgi:hypothetical protein
VHLPSFASTSILFGRNNITCFFRVRSTSRLFYRPGQLMPEEEANLETPKRDRKRGRRRRGATEAALVK